MSRVGVMMSADRPDAAMSSHFGKAPWVMVADSEGGVPEFVRNDGLNGRSAAEIAVRQGCTDVVLTEIGDGALGHLQAAQIRAWAAPGPVTGSEALKMFSEGQLPEVPATRVGAGHGKGHGCCCGSGAGHETHACCRG